MKESVIFSNAVARYNEMRLLKKEQLTRLSDAADYAEAVKMLYDYGYYKADKEDIDSLVTAQIAALIEYIIDECPDAMLEEILLNDFRYNNAKLYYKSRFVELPVAALYPVDDSAIKDAIESRDYAALSQQMRACVEKLDGETADGRRIDAEFNRAMTRENLALAKKSGSKSLKKYLVTRIDLDNINTLFRCRALKKDFAFCAEMLCEGGKVPLADVEKNYSADDKELIEAFAAKGYGEYAAKAAEKFAESDALKEVMLLDASATESLEYCSLSPFFGYCLKRLAEIKVVKMILTCIRNNARDEIEKRMRGIYE